MVLKFDQSKLIKAPIISTIQTNSSQSLNNSTAITKLTTDIEIGVLKIDSIYVLTLFFILIGFLWLSSTRKIFEKLKKVPNDKWIIIKS